MIQYEQLIDLVEQTKRGFLFDVKKDDINKLVDTIKNMDKNEAVKFIPRNKKGSEITIRRNKNSDSMFDAEIKVGSRKRTFSQKAPALQTIRKAEKSMKGMDKKFIIRTMKGV